MSAGKEPPAVSVMVSEPLVVVTGRLAAHELSGDARLSAGVAMKPDGGSVVSDSRVNPNSPVMIVDSSASKLFPVLLSTFFGKLTPESQIQFKKPPTEPRTVFVL